MMRIKLIRDEFGIDYTLGTLLIDGVEFCHTLEDTARADNVKIPGHTCVPPSICEAVVSLSQRFKREMLLLFNHYADFSIRVGMVKFTGIRPHGGNTVLDTAGCPIVAFKRKGEKEVYGNAETKLFSIAKDAALAGELIWQFVNEPKTIEETL